MGAVVADLLFALTTSAEGWTYRSLRPEAFTGSGVGYRSIIKILTALKDMQFCEMKPGYRSGGRFEENEDWIAFQSNATRFRATAELIGLAANLGVTIENVREHFSQGLPTHPIIRKAASKRRYGRKIPGRRMSYEKTEQTRKLEERVRKLDEFISHHKIDGGLHLGFNRIFNEGDVPDFDWNRGGRLYSVGDSSYQLLDKESRLRMTIDDEAVAELDIRASYLTILHGLYGRSGELPADPYEISDLPREVVKKWLVATLGRDCHIKRWPTDLIGDYEEETGEDLRKYPVRIVRERVLEQLPLLRQWGELEVGWGTLMYIESEAIIRTMEELMEQGVVSLPIHDSLIVSVPETFRAYKLLEKNYRGLCGADPQITVACH